eukprot:11657171-Karenia_brevis.AAC.1
MNALPSVRWAVMNKSAPSLSLGSITASSCRALITVKLPDLSNMVGQLRTESCIGFVAVTITMFSHVGHAIIRD